MKSVDTDHLEFPKGPDYVGLAPTDEHGRRLDVRNYPGVVFRCPKCGGETEYFRAREGVHAGKPFYGCTGWPDCDSITEMDGTIIAPHNPVVSAENYRKLADAHSALRTAVPVESEQAQISPDEEHEWGPLPF